MNRDELLLIRTALEDRVANLRLRIKFHRASGHHVLTELLEGVVENYQRVQAKVNQKINKHLQESIKKFDNWPIIDQDDMRCILADFLSDHTDDIPKPVLKKLIDVIVSDKNIKWKQSFLSYIGGWHIDVIDGLCEEGIVQCTYCMDHYQLSPTELKDAETPEEALEDCFICKNCKKDKQEIYDRKIDILQSQAITLGYILVKR